MHKCVPVCPPTLCHISNLAWQQISIKLEIPLHSIHGHAYMHTGFGVSNGSLRLKANSYVDECKQELI